MITEPTTVVVQRYLEALARDQPAEPIARALLDRAVRRLQLLCGNLLYRQFLAHRGLSTDLRIALLIEEPLIERDCLDIYRQAVQELTGKAWKDIRHGPVRS